MKEHCLQVLQSLSLLSLTACGKSGHRQYGSYRVCNGGSIRNFSTSSLIVMSSYYSRGKTGSHPTGIFDHCISRKGRRCVSEAVDAKQGHAMSSSWSGNSHRGGAFRLLPARGFRCRQYISYTHGGRMAVDRNNSNLGRENRVGSGAHNKLQ